MSNLQKRIFAFLEATGVPPDDTFYESFSKEIRALIDQLSYSSQFDFVEKTNELKKIGIDLLLDLHNSNQIKAKLMGIAILDCLLDINDENTLNRRAEISSILRRILEMEKSSLDLIKIVIDQASQCIGHFARVATPNEIEYIQSNLLSFADSLIESKSDANRYSAVMIFKQIAINQPNIIYSKRKQLFEQKHIWGTLSDKVNLIRLEAASFLELSLQTIFQRDAVTNYPLIAFEVAQSGFDSKSTEVILGSISILSILTNGTTISAQDIRNKISNTMFASLTSRVLAVKDQPDPEVQTRVIRVLPALAGAFPNVFIQSKPSPSEPTFFAASLSHLMASVRVPRNRDEAYRALGKLFVSLANHLRSAKYLNPQQIFSCVTDGFNKSEFSLQALRCLGLVIRVSHPIRNLLTTDVIDSMFAQGLSETLINTLKVIFKLTPVFRSYIQAELIRRIDLALNAFSVIVETQSTASRPLRTTSSTELIRSSISVSAPQSNKQRSTSIFSLPKRTFGKLFGSSSSSSNNTQIQTQRNADEELVLAMRTLATSELFPKLTADSLDQGQNNNTKDSAGTLARSNSGSLNLEDMRRGLLDAVVDGVMAYLVDSNPLIRLTAASTCGSVLDSIVLAIEPNSRQFARALKVVDRLLILGVGDDMAEIRYRVFQSFTPAMDYLISLSPQNHCLLEAIHDECMEVRASAMTVLCRAAFFDPVHIMPMIQLDLTNYVRQLNGSGDMIQKRETILMIQSMVRGLNSLVIPYVRQLLTPLMSLINDSSPKVVSAALTSISELAFTSPESVQGSLSEIFPRLILALTDPTSNIRQEIAVVAMGKLVPALTMSTEEPYARYPLLLGGLIRAIQSKDDLQPSNDVPSSSFRYQAMRTAGLLGAVPEHVYVSHLQGLIQSQEQIEKAGSKESINPQVDEADEEVEEGEEDLDEDDQLSTIEHLYFSTVMKQLIGILEEVHHSPSTHTQASNAAIKVIRIVGLHAKPFLQSYIDSLVYLLYHGEPNNFLQETLIDHLISLLDMVGSIMRKFTQKLILLIRDFSSSHLIRCLNLVLAFRKIFSFSDFEHFLVSIIPTLSDQIMGEVTLGSEKYSSYARNGASFLLSSSTLESEEYTPSHLGGGSNRPQPSVATRSNLSPQLNSQESSQTLVLMIGDNSPPISSKTAVRNAISGTSKPSSSSLKTQFPKTKLILQAIARISNSIGRHKSKIVQLIVIVLKLASSFPSTSVNSTPNSLNELLLSALTALICFAKDNDITDSASIVIHSLIRLIGVRSDSPPPFQNNVLCTLSFLLCKLGGKFIPFILPLKRRLWVYSTQHSKSPQLDELESLLNRLVKGRPLPTEPSQLIDLIRAGLSLGAIIGVSSAVAVSTIPVPSDGRESIKESSSMGFLTFQSLETAWALAGRNSASDLIEWKRRISIELIAQSPSPIIRSCATLAKSSRNICEELFNISFHSMWEEIFAAEHYELGEEIPVISAIETALSNPDLPRSVMISLLNLSEFMDMKDRALPLNYRLLAQRAHDANMFGLSLRFFELEVNNLNWTPSQDCVAGLISSQHELGLGEQHVLGSMKRMLKMGIIQEIHPLWLEKILKWEDAKQLYQKKNLEFQLQHPDSDLSLSSDQLEHINFDVGELRCLEALGEYELLAEKALKIKSTFREIAPIISTSASTYQSSYSAFDVATPEEVSAQFFASGTELNRLGARTSWMLNRWEDMEAYLDTSSSTGSEMSLDSEILSPTTNSTASTSSDSLTGVILDKNLSFYRTILAIHKQDFSQAMTLIAETRERIMEGVSSLLSENYSRAHRAMVSMQILSELEEIIEYKEALSSANLDRPSSNSTVGSSSSTVASLSRGRGSSTFNGIDFRSRESEAFGLGDMRARKQSLMRKWRNRLKWAPRDVSVYRQILSVHTLVAEPSEDLDSWLELVSLGSSEGMYSLCESVLRRLGSPLFTHPSSSDYSSRTSSVNAKVLLATHNYLWVTGEKHRALNELTSFLRDIPSIDLVSHLKNSLSSDTEQENNEFSTETRPISISGVGRGVIASPVPLNRDSRMFHASCLLKKAEWIRELRGVGESSMSDMLDTVRQAIDIAHDHYSTWHAWAALNFNQLQSLESQSSDSISNTQEDDQFHLGALTGIATLNSSQATFCVIEAIRGYVKSIVLGRNQNSSFGLQDILRLLTLWFSYGTRIEVYQILEEELERIMPDCWLQVLPQLIARMHVKSPQISSLLEKLLIKVASIHPQPLVCPISVALSTTNEHQKQLAHTVLSEMRKRDNVLVEEAAMVSEELMKTSASPHELWYDGIEKACTAYISGNVQEMFQLLLNLHASSTISTESASASQDDSIGRGTPSNMRDIAFNFQFGRLLSDAFRWLRLFETTRNVADLHQAWDIYHSVWKTLETQIKCQSKLELHHISPALAKASNLQVAMLGTYDPFQPIISIARFKPSINVIQSKQRPRRIAMIGSNGRTYQYLLKGNEDLRQDERVMQLFGLINVCLEQDKSQKSNIEIVRYSVLPLSNNFGVIGWVENCDTLNSLIQQYRTSKGVKTGVEINLLKLKSSNYDLGISKAPNKNSLTLMQRLEIFQEIINETSGADLANMLWLTSKSAELWVERRNNFRKSMAVMSMVGYLLGLGDRHPSNLMLDRVSGRVVHIDFGDCFEITAHRPKFPEIVPFRLTRMLTKCMGMVGTAGTFQTTAEKVMRLLRVNRDSVMAMLEAFVYDPLISWRLLEKGEDNVASPPPAGTADEDPKVLEGDPTLSPALSPPSSSSPLDILKQHQESMKEHLGSTEALLQTSHLSLTSPNDSAPRTTESKSQSLHRPALEETDTIELNTKALEIIRRIQSKLTGRDFASGNNSKQAKASPLELSVEDQVERLILEATSSENLCQMYIGWCPFW